jgi:hypothetical protein
VIRPPTDRDRGARIFYRSSLALPLAVPLLVILLFRIAPWHPPAAVGTALAYVGISIFFGGIPYAALATWGLFWIGHHSESEIRARAVVAPLLMVPAYGLQCAIAAAVGGGVDVAVRIFFLGSVLILILGYAYVLVVFGLRTALRT